ncbi:hypothetical protein [uncultured Umboniibacter sp.]|uniref:hypothetical protein n=1 Tax=uncultured Umboniibacter sp. TaxID=1798917 RepID=UPI002622AA2C|nr:hypothetical protein [uncultured Umboniibacter sp.]
MGFFSYNTCDTSESIPAPASSRYAAPRLVYLPTVEGIGAVSGFYDGYGRIDDTDVHTWLAIANTGIDSRALGIILDCGTNYHRETDTFWVCDFAFDEAERNLIINGLTQFASHVQFFPGYDSPIDHFGDANMNQLKAKGIIEDFDFATQLKHPLKLSFDPNCDFDRHGASTPCRYQGFFYD